MWEGSSTGDRQNLLSIFWTQQAAEIEQASTIAAVQILQEEEIK